MTTSISRPASTSISLALQHGVPLTVLDVVSNAAAGLYAHALVLSRPDQHVAWRGDAIPADAAGLVEMLRGAR